jgi:DNA topoisomerase-1
MAKTARQTGGKPLMIVESPAKARTISKFLGRNFVVEASIGHIRDLPENAGEVPKEYKGQSWARLGVNVDEGFKPIYVIPAKKAQQVRKLKKLVREASELYLATDEDREGEAISWHLREVLQPRVPVHRLVFHEITAEAIRQALASPRDINESLVQAQEARRILDRLYGYEVSPLLWKKVRPKLSAGRVQSVAVRMIVERERERMAFRSASYWDLLGLFARANQERLEAVLASYQGRRIPAGKDFDPKTGLVRDPGLLVLSEGEARQLAERLHAAEFRVASVEEQTDVSRPAPPFTTSTLQQEAHRKLGFTARRTMQVAQSLYENGHITYMRTDSTALADEAVAAARDLIRQQYGPEFLPDAPRHYATKVKNAQEAHEAIRPAGHPFELPETLRGELSEDEFKLFELIWKRTIASQMKDARGRRIVLWIEGGGARFQATGKIIDFAGYLRAYVEGADDPEAELADREKLLPAVVAGERLECVALEPKGHETQPPPRYNEASLTQALESQGIGRPSTYATIIETILARDYVFKRGRSLVPTWTAFAVCQLLEKHLGGLVDYKFTAEMEDELDSISRGEGSHVEYLRQFYFGNSRPGLKPELEAKADQIDARDVTRIWLGRPESGPDIYVRVGRYGPFLEQGERKASIPNEMAPDELTVERALALLEESAKREAPLGHDENGQPIYLRFGRFGPYVQRGGGESNGKAQNASLPRGMKPEEVNLETALALLSLPRTLGRFPDDGSPLAGQPVLAHNGRYGPYVKCASETRSLPTGLSPLAVTLQQAIDLLRQPKPARRKFGVPREPLRTLGTAPATGATVSLFEGRYGPYVSDGTTNASVPKGTPLEEVTLQQACHWLEERRASGASKPRSRGSRSRAGGAAAARRTKATTSSKVGRTRSAASKASKARKSTKASKGQAAGKARTTRQSPAKRRAARAASAAQEA